MLVGHKAIRLLGMVFGLKPMVVKSESESDEQTVFCQPQIMRWGERHSQKCNRKKREARVLILDVTHRSHLRRKNGCNTLNIMRPSCAPTEWKRRVQDGLCV